MTSPYAFHQYFLNAEDERVVDYLKVFSPRSREEIADLERQAREEPHLRAAQRALADDVTDLVHSVSDREAAVTAAAALFGRSDLAGVPESVLSGVVAEIGGVPFTGPGLPSVVDVLEVSGVVPTRSAARRAIADGGAYLNNRKVADPEAVVTEADLLHGRYVIVRRGKRTIGAVMVTPG